MYSSSLFVVIILSSFVLLTMCKPFDEPKQDNSEESRNVQNQEELKTSLKAVPKAEITDVIHAEVVDEKVGQMKVDDNKSPVVSSSDVDTVNNKVEDALNERVTLDDLEKNEKNSKKRSASESGNKKVDTGENVGTILKSDSEDNLRFDVDTAKVETIKNSPIFLKTDNKLSDKISQNDDASSDSVTAKELNKLDSPDTFLIKKAVDIEDDTLNPKLKDKLSGKKALQKRSENTSIEDQDRSPAENEKNSETDTESVFRGLNDNTESDQEESKIESSASTDLPSRRSNSRGSSNLDTIQDKLGRPSIEFSDEELIGNTKKTSAQIEASISAENLGVRSGIVGNVVSDAPFATRSYKDFDTFNNNGNAGKGTPQLQNLLFHYYHPLTVRPSPFKFFPSPQLRLFRSPLIQEIRKFTSQETFLPESPGISDGFVLPEKPIFSNFGYNPKIQYTPPFDFFNNKGISQNIPSPIRPFNPFQQPHLTPSNTNTLQNPMQPDHNWYQPSPKSGTSEHFEDYINDDNDNPRIDDYTTLDQNAYVFKGKGLKVKPRDGIINNGEDHQMRPYTDASINLYDSFLQPRHFAKYFNRL